MMTAIAAIGVVACGTDLPHPPYAPQPTSALTEIAFPPPPARVEAVPARPTKVAAHGDVVWLDGEWTWRTRRWSWKPGRWIVPPEGATYSPWTAVRGDDGALFYAPGAWRNARGEAVTEPAAIATAKAASGVIFSAEGEVERTGRTVSGGHGAPKADGGS
jgi:hypothetical protein